MEFKKESVKACYEEALPLLKAHWEEIAHYKDIPLEPIYEEYLKIEELGLTRVYTSRKEGKLIGYMVVFVRYHMHYASSLHAVQDILFISEAHRGIGAKFILWCEDQLRAEGVQVICQHMKAAHDKTVFMRRLGYELVDHIFTKRLDT